VVKRLDHTVNLAALAASNPAFMSVTPLVEGADGFACCRISELCFVTYSQELELGPTCRQVKSLRCLLF
jgi:hypothetical protein